MDSPAAVAKPYARAAFSHAAQSGGVAEWSAALGAAAQALAIDAMRRALASPERGGQAFDLLCEIVGEPAGAQREGVRNLLRLMRENRRLGALGQVASRFEDLRREDARRVEAAMVSAVPVDEAQQREIARAIRARFGRDVEFRVAVDEGLVGGARIQVGDQVLDGSARASLQRLAAALVRPANQAKRQTGLTE